MDIVVFEAIKNFWLPLVILVLLANWMKKYIEKSQEDHITILKEKNKLELELRKNESKEMIDWINKLIDKVTSWNTEILASNDEQRVDHKIIIETLTTRYNCVDQVIDIIKKDIENISITWKETKNLLEKHLLLYNK